MAGSPEIVRSASLPVYENAAEAGCYTFLGEIWMVDESHPELTRQIREEADPRYVPLICRRVYRSPAGTETRRDYHVIGKYIPQAGEGFEDAYIQLAWVPRKFPFPAGRIQPLRTLWAKWERGSVEDNNNTPPAVVKMGPWVVEQMKALRKVAQGTICIEGEKVTEIPVTRAFLEELLNEQETKDLAEVEKARQEIRYRMRHNWKQLKEAADNGRWSPEPPEASPFVDLGRKGA